MLTRKAVLGFASFCAMVERRCEARGDIEMPMGAPESSVRGCRIARAGVAREGSAVVAAVRRAYEVTEATGVFFLSACTGLAVLFNADGARKSRYGSCKVAAVWLYPLAVLCTMLVVRTVRAVTLLTARKHEMHIVDDEAIAVVLIVDKGSDGDV